MSTINNLERSPSAYGSHSAPPSFPFRISKVEIDNITTAIANEFELAKEMANNLALQLLSSQFYLSENNARSIEKTDSVPHQLVVSQNAIFPIKFENFIGRGSCSQVFKVNMIVTYPHQLGETLLKAGDVATIALKIWPSIGNNSPSYSPEKKVLQNFLSPQKRGIDHHLATFAIPLHSGYSVHQLFNASLDKFQFDKCRSPVKTMFSVYLSIIHGLCSLHDRKGIHKDIKPGNLLALVSEDEIIGAITDWSFLTYQGNKIHKTSGTPEYLDPAMFGSIQDTLINQRKREGLQTKEGDIFAFGVTNIEVLLLLISNISINSIHKEEISAIIGKIRPKLICGSFTNEELKEYGKKYPYRAMYRHATPSIPEKLIIYPPLDVVEKNLLRACNLLEDCLSSIEIIALSLLSIISCKMQEPNLACRPNIHEIQNKFIDIRNVLEQKEQYEFVDEISPAKKKRKLMPRSDGSTKPSRFLLSVDSKIVKSLSNLIVTSKIELLACYLINCQKNIADGKIAHILVNKISFYVTNTEIHIPNQQIASNSKSVDFACSSIPTTSHQLGNIPCSIGDTLELTLRIYELQKTSFSNVKNNLDMATAGKKIGIEDFIILYKDNKGIEYSLHKPYLAPLAEIPYHEINKPAFTLVKILIQTSEGLSSIHATNHIHRNIKETNILITTNKAFITDFSFLMKEMQTPHPTIGTSFYFDPAMFGSIENTLENQKKRIGIQSKEGDIYAFGIMIIYKILYKFLSQIIDDSLEATNLFDSLTPKWHTGSFNEEQLQTLGINHPYRIVYEYNYSTKIESVIIFPKISDTRIIINKILHNCINKLSEQEIQIISQVADLANDMQERKNRPSAEEIKEKLKNILHN